MLYHTRAKSFKPSLQGRCAVKAYALAVSEHNASGGLIVTAPPVVLQEFARSPYHLNKEHGFKKQIIWALQLRPFW